jgi:hypothetical protein
LLCSHCLSGQIVIQGTVTDKAGQALAGINVLLNPKGSANILAYALSDNKGYYRLQYNGNIDSLQLTLTGFDYEKVIREIRPLSQTLNFALAEAPVNLKEVVVKAEPISQKGDTLTYFVASFAGKSDRVIGDVLKKMPGIEVSKSGLISYQGKSIIKFYVENLDLLQGRYAIATNNISVQDIASVQVYEFHQPIKALANSQPSDQAAINLTLKSNVRGVWNAMAQIGLGAAPLLWENELISLYFARKMQSINMYKGNNSGNDVSNELTAFYSDRDNMLYDGKLLSVLAPTPPEIKVDRYLFNNINMASTNILRVFPNESEVVANVNYYNDRQNSNSRSRSSYYLPNNNILIVDETLDAVRQINNLNTTVKYTVNQDRFYLTNALDVTASWVDNTGIAATVDTVNQALNTNSYNISNKLEFIRNFSNDKSYRIYSFNGFVRTPQSLHIQPGLYEDILSNGFPYNQLRQTTSFNNFVSLTSFNFSTANRGFRQNYYGGLDIAVQSLQSLLQARDNNGLPMLVAPDSLQNNLGWEKYKVFLSANYSYAWRRFEIEFSLPISYNHLLINDKLPDSRQTINRVLFNPSLIVRYRPNRYWNIRANYGRYDNLGNINNTYTGYIMRNYRNFNKYDGTLADATTNSAALSFAYRNPLKALFFNINLMYEHFSSNMMYDLSYNGILQIQQAIHQPTSSDTYGIGGSISKAFYALNNSTVSLSANYYTMSAVQMNQGELTDFRYYGYWVKPTIESQVASWGSISLASLWNNSKIAIENSTQENPTIQSLSNYLIINLFPWTNWSIGSSVEHYYNNAVSDENNKFFADVNLRYKTSKLEIMAKWSNIFNTGQHIMASYSETSEFVYVYDIRPSQILMTVKFKLW